jgi:Ankyrin repeats (3 copies)
LHHPTRTATNQQPADYENVHVNARHSQYSGQQHYNGGVTPLMLASRSGHIPVCIALVQEFGATIDLFDEEDWSARHYASSNGYDDICRFLLEELQHKQDKLSENTTSTTSSGCEDNINKKTVDGGVIDSARMLLQQKTQFEKATPIDFARHRKFRAVVQILASHGSTCNATVISRSATSTTVPSSNWSDEDQVEALTNCLEKLHKFKPRHKRQTGLFLFRYQMDMGNFDKLESLLRRGISQAKLPIPKHNEFCKNLNSCTGPTTDTTILNRDRMVVLDA